MAAPAGGNVPAPPVPPPVGGAGAGAGAGAVAQPGLLTGAQIVTDVNITEEATIRQALFWIGFRTPIALDVLRDDGLESFSDIRMMTEQDISTMATSFAGRTAANGRMHFGTRRIKYLKAMTHWVRDFYRVSSVPSIIGLCEDTLKPLMDRAAARAIVRKNMAEQTKTSAEAASPGPLENEKQWKHWEEKFVNYAKSHIGANGIPLSYVVRENDQPHTNGNHPDFVAETIACAPLSGEYYQADSTSVFNMIVSFTTGQPSGDWIKSTLKHSDGRRSMEALRKHFAGEGNATRNLAEAERLHESIHYKNERAMTFEVFLTQCQKMFNIYEKEGEEMADEAKVRFLFRKVQHAGLRSSIDALKATQTTGTVITYTMAANHLSTAVSELPEYLAKNARNVSGVQTNNGGGGGNNSGVYNADGSINTGHIPNWKSLSFQERKIVIDERKRTGIRYKKKSGAGAGKHGNSQSQSNRLKQLAEQNSKYKRTIKALKRKSQENDKEDDDAEEDIDAGDQFGGKASKKQQKKK